MLELDPATIVRKGRLQPGKMFLVDTAAGRVIEDHEIKAELAAEEPLRPVAARGHHQPRGPVRPGARGAHPPVVPAPAADLRLHRGGVAHPGRSDGAHRDGAHRLDGHRHPIAAISERPRLLFDYFAQLFAQVTNPPLDALREEIVTSLYSNIGPEGNLLDTTPAQCRQVVLPFPVIDNDELAKILHINDDGDMPGFQAIKVKGLYRVHDGGEALAARLEEIFAEIDGPSRPECGSWCCPTARATSSTARSRRCC